MTMPPQEKLLYHWSGEDDLVGGKWYDKVQGLPWTKEKTIAPKTSDQKGYKTGSSSNAGGFIMNINTQESNNGTVGLNMGRCWRIVIDCEPTAMGGTSTTTAYIADFCGNRETHNGFAFGFNRTATIPRTIYEIGDKNYTAPVETEGTWFQKRITYEYGCKVKQGRYYQYVKVTDGVETVESEASISHPRFVFDKNYWSFNNENVAFLGKAYGSSFNQMILYDVKIYGTQDYE